MVLVRQCPRSRRAGHPRPDPVRDPVRGLHIATFQSAVLATSDQLTAIAHRQWERDRDGHRYLVTSQDSLSSDAPITIWDCVPGRFFVVNSEETCAQVLGELFRLYNVAVEFAGTGDGRCVETRVAVDLGPPGVGTRSAARVSV